ncbi:chitinase-3-like protein 1 [Toxorhynchites rutilus septentrionalis]|uniref:chitinase-3-like protein 1 n=1 Tax=Toxorhynchites rutilus septentrionalis TaxID=329112 RepID=UPI002479EA03|nr:chitinase-3-like protein 1 [Toxorhynchites rutilus septentrionalis]
MSPIYVVATALVAFAILNVPVDSGAIKKDPKKLVVAYFGSWANYRRGNGRFVAENMTEVAGMIDILVYTFVDINPDGTIRYFDPWLDLQDGLGMMNRTVSLKSKNPDMKVLVAIGGWNAGSHNFSIVAKDPELRLRFAEEAVNLCLRHGFDGFDMDWEYPNQRGGHPEDVGNFVLMLKDLKHRLSKHNLILTAAVAAAESSASQSYDIPGMSKYLDYIFVMTYDFHGPWNPFTGHNSPMFPGPRDLTDNALQLNVDAAMRFWLREGAPPEKLVVGVAFYGRTFTLRSTVETGIGAPANGAGVAGPYTGEAGFLGYNEVCERTQARGWRINWSEDQHVPYKVLGDQWVGYDDSTSLMYKVNLAHEFKLAGVMLWSIETDDFNGICGNGKFPLLSILDVAARDRDAINTTPKPTTQAPTEPTQPTSPPPPGQCGVGDKAVADPKNCANFIKCPIVEGSAPFRCQSDLLFNEISQKCDWPENVECNDRPIL